MTDCKHCGAINQDFWFGYKKVVGGVESPHKRKPKGEGKLDVSVEYIKEIMGRRKKYFESMGYDQTGEAKT